MSIKKKFTEDEIQALEQNPNTLSVNENRISFTLEAKKKILDLYGTGVGMRQALKKLGYDPDVLGDGRIKSIIRNIQDQANSNSGLHQGYYRQDTRKRLSLDEISDLKTDETSVIKLKNEVIYLRAEVEFLKKISQQAISKKRDK